MILKKILFPLCILLISCGCITNKKLNQKETSSPKKTYQQIAQKKFGEQVEYKLNQNKSRALCKKMINTPITNPNELIEFFVYDIQQEEIIFEDKIANAKISWHNNTQLLITKQKGYITGPTDTGKYTYIFDLKSKKKITPNKTQ